MQSKKKLIFFLFFIPSSLYIFKLLKLTATARTSSIHLPTNPCSTITIPYLPHKPSPNSTFHEEEPLSLKELNFLSSVISTKKPNRNLLFFGLNPQFFPLADAGIGGAAVFLEDDSQLIRRFRGRAPGRVEVHMVRYGEMAGRAYELLRHGRENADCRRRVIGYADGTSCRLAMAGLPRKIYEQSWDVVVVDGPRGHRPDAPGRMEAIYTAAVVARMGNGTDVVVHDVDRMIEKWYSWEFLCQENLVSAKGRLWHFRIQGSSPSDGFCSTKKIQIL